MQDMSFEYVPVDHCPQELCKSRTYITKEEALKLWPSKQDLPIYKENDGITK